MNALTLPATVRGRISYHEPLAPYTSWHVGGPADVFFAPADKADLSAFLQALAPQTAVFWLGLGSNVLVRDGGVRAVVIATHGALSDVHRIDATDVWCDAGVPCAKLAKCCAQWQLGPAEFFAGIPGTVGGALAMNAGAFGGETWPHVVAVEVMDRQGAIRTRPVTDYQVSYRHVEAPPHEWFLGARFRFTAQPTQGDAGIRQLLARRKQTQPLGAFSCGSVFMNPPGMHAAQLIESAGLKGFRIGAAEVSPKHANFIINTGHATAAELEQLIKHVQQVVLQHHGVSLHTEVRIVGEA